jgi:hypothetical protein
MQIRRTALNVASARRGGRCRGPPGTPAIEQFTRRKPTRAVVTACLSQQRTFAHEVPDDAGRQKRRKATKQRGTP